jgi:CRP/FNR family transcriptional regulator, dissimilatory nitrate respiration regulator
MVTNGGIFMNRIDKYIDALTSINLFRGFDSNKLKTILDSERCSLTRHSKGQLVYFQNEICHSMDIILDGEVSVQKIDAEGNILTIETFSAMDHLGANLLFSSRKKYPMTVAVEADAFILHLERELVVDLIQKHRSFMEALLQAVSDRTLLLTDKINAISLNTIREQLLAYLRYESLIQKSNTVTLDISKKKLAEKLGVQRSSLGRELQKMRSDGLISYDRKTIILEDLLSKKQPYSK